MKALKNLNIDRDLLSLVPASFGNYELQRLLRLCNKDKESDPIRTIRMFDHDKYLRYINTRDDLHLLSWEEFDNLFTEVIDFPLDPTIERFINKMSSLNFPHAIWIYQ